jgi:hypothetical protein
MDGNYIIGEAVKGFIIAAGLVLKDWILKRGEKIKQDSNHQSHKRRAKRKQV